MIPAHEAPLAIRRVSFRPGRAICHLVKPSLTIETQNPQLMKTATAVVLSNGWAALLLALASGLRRGWRFLLRSALPYALTSRIYGTTYSSHQALVTSGHHRGSLFG